MLFQDPGCATLPTRPSSDSSGLLTNKFMVVTGRRSWEGRMWSQTKTQASFGESLPQTLQNLGMETADHHFFSHKCIRRVLNFRGQTRIFVSEELNGWNFLHSTYISADY